jgi:hypothetical protein
MGIVIRARGKTELGVVGPYVRMIPGHYQVRFKLGVSPIPPDDELLKIDVTNRGCKVYADIVLRWRDLISEPDGIWATVNFSLPASLPRYNVFEFRVWTMGKTDLVVRSINLTRDLHDIGERQGVTRLYSMPRQLI